MSRVVIAPDSFKGTANAADAAAAIARGWQSVRADDEVITRPMADGGEGTLDAFEAAVPGARRMRVAVRGPVSSAVITHWLLLPDGTGVVELAATSGITLLDPLAPLDAHSAGFGEAIVDALDTGVERLLLALGGSASTDGGAGALSALGARFLDADQATVQLGNRGLGALAVIDLAGLRPLPRGGALILGDVTNPLLGERGAAAVFGPQKGADAATVAVLDANLARFARLVPDVASDTPGAGAAGGTAFALLVWGAAMGGGAELIADALALERDIAGADLVITGEGRFDGQSEAGKAPSEVARLAASCGVPVALVAGAITAEPRGFAASVDLTRLAGGGEPAMADPLRWLEAAGARLAAEVEIRGAGPS
ncbi:glycerate kinase [Agromyces sp. NPDC056379]|uniref:glycerate kinase n=1 Tax=unclassified Agromyces TaxID=2639701 RepID=UPI0035DFA13C